MNVNLVLPLLDIDDRQQSLVGGKAWALSALLRADLPVPQAVAVTAEAYRTFLRDTGLGQRISMEINRKRFEDMRWEELWDTALRIKNLFLNTSVPKTLYAEMEKPLTAVFKDCAVAVRSSAPEEDSAGASFAGLHESYVNIQGVSSIVNHIKLVWASLWSDRALLYRRELRLQVEKSAMAVLVQELVAGEKSGIVFSRHPNDQTKVVIEAVHGMNQGLVDGAVEPDRWLVQRSTGRIVSHEPSSRESTTVLGDTGVCVIPLPEDMKSVAPLTDGEVGAVFDLAIRSERFFGSPQDVEWTFYRGKLHVLQSRPVTTGRKKNKDDERGWYLSLRRTFENLSALRARIEHQLLPAMDSEAQQLAGEVLTALSNEALALEIERREKTYKRWQKTYWDEFIPMAHGIRLFGEVYNDTVSPADPYEFMKLLGDTDMISLKRNRLLEDMAAMVREDQKLFASLHNGGSYRQHEAFCGALEAFIKDFGDLSCSTDQCLQGPHAIISLVLEMAKRKRLREPRRAKDFDVLREAFFASFHGEKKAFAQKLLDLARASYRLRDDDNIHIGRIKAQLARAVDEARTRVSVPLAGKKDSYDPQQIVEALRNPGYIPKKIEASSQKNGSSGLRARQLVGQPAGPGVGQGRARVVLEPSDLLDFKAGEILVCDAIDPTMTFVVPLSEGIVERRGGMLIHGAIIAREYGLPCVTGVPDATSFIHTGDPLVVDGYLGIVKIKDDKENDA